MTFERKVDRSGDHHFWLGAKDPERGTGRAKVNGKVTTAHRAAWELANGPLPRGSRVMPCPEQPACVRLEHLSIMTGNGPGAEPARPGRGRKGAGTMTQVGPQTWKLTVTVGEYTDGRRRRVSRRVHVPDANAAARELAVFVAEAQGQALVVQHDLKDLTMNEAVDLFLTEYLSGEKGREDQTVEDYRELHWRWFAPHIGGSRVRDVNEAILDKLFGRMRRSGLSRSRLNHAKSLYAPFFRWAKRRGIITRNPMLEFQLPTSTYVSKQRTPPEVEELSLLLAKAVEVIPEVAPLLVLGAVTGMRRGELVGIRRSRVLWDELEITVDTAVGDHKQVKGTKTRKNRTFHVDADTIDMLRRHCDLMDERAAACGTPGSGGRLPVQSQSGLFRAPQPALPDEAGRPPQGPSRHRPEVAGNDRPRRRSASSLPSAGEGPPSRMDGSTAEGRTPSR